MHQTHQVSHNVGLKSTLHVHSSGHSWLTRVLSRKEGGKGSCMYLEVWGIPLKENIEILGPLNRNLRGKIPPIELHLFKR